MFSLEALGNLIEEADYFRGKKTVFTSRNEKFRRHMRQKFPPCPKLTWEDEHATYTAEFRVVETEEKLCFFGIYTKNGVPVSSQRVRNSYHRMLARLELSNMRSVC